MDLSLDEIIKKDRGSKRGGRGRGGQRGTPGARGQQRRRGAQAPGGQDRGNRSISNRPSAPYKRGNVDDRWSHDMYDNSSGGGGRGDVRSGAQRRSGQEPCKLMISNLDFGVTDADVKELFGEFGPMRSAAVHYDRSGRSMGTAQVIFERRSDAVRAMKQYGGVPLDGRPMKLELATDQVGGGARGGSASTRLGRAPRANRGGGGSTRGRGGGRGGGGRGGRGGKQEKRKPATAEELDAELDAYVNSAK